jgi:hypothetical protein
VTNPRSVKQILIKRSAPQPATMKTPIGGTIHVSRPFFHPQAAQGLPRRVMRIKKIAAIIFAVEMFVRVDFVIESVRV